MSKIYVARVVLEATTPLKTASGKSDLFTDMPVMKDWNGLPMILGSSIAGVLRSSFDDEKQKDLFGFQENKSDEGKGSRVIISNALLYDDNQDVHQSLEIDLKKDDFLNHYYNLPIREHTAIEHTGVAKERSKFDEEIVYKGSRFVFEIELIGDNKNEAIWQELLQKLYSKTFRLGGGSTKGFGEMKVLSIDSKVYSINEYGDKPSDFNNPLNGEKVVKVEKSKDSIIVYTIELMPEDFFIFGAGFGDDKIDDVAVTEKIVSWKDDKGEFSTKEQILIPASSIKGALSHRVAYHYNLLEEKYADTDEVKKNKNEYLGENNKAVAEIFGVAKGHENESKGSILLSDMFKEFKEEVKVFDHVKIDRFTGGAIDSALFNEKTIAQKDTWMIEIVLTKELKGNIEKAFKNTLDDLARGWLPIGGKVNRGHGVFISPNYVEGDKSRRGWSCNTGGCNE